MYIILGADEEISAMRKELDKYGIQMPTFSKIGGILANEVMAFSRYGYGICVYVMEAILGGLVI